jgi:hypothetical protein
MTLSTTASTSAGPFTAKLAPLAQQLRGSYSVVRPVSQVVLQLRGKPGADAFEIARNTVIGWIKNRAGRPLPPEAAKGESFELEEVGSQRTAAVAIDSPRYWAARLDDSDKDVARRDWVTEVGIAERPNKDVIFGGRLQCVTIGEDRPFDASIPGFVRTIIQRVPTVRVEGRSLSLDPWIVQTAEDVEALIACITSKSRRLDVIVCALPEGSEDPATAAIRADQLHMRTLGTAHVAIITGPASFFLSDHVGKEFSVFRGAVRSYRPEFDTTLDEPFRHPLALPNRIAEWPDGGRESYERFLVAQTLARAAAVRDADKQLPPFTEVRRVSAQLRLDSARNAGTSDSNLVVLFQQENETLRDALEKDRTTYQGLVDQYEQDRSLALEEAQQAQAANAHLRHRIHALEERLKSHAPVVSKVPIPKSLDDFESWCRDHLSGSVEVHNRAIQAVKKSRYEDIELIYKALLLLRDSYVPMKREGGLEKKQLFERQCRELGLSEDPTFSGDRWGEEGDTYKVRYAGRPRLLDRHFKKGNAKDERYCLRLYFFWDEDSEQAVVGWLPSHLDTRIT